MNTSIDIYGRVAWSRFETALRYRLGRAAFASVSRFENCPITVILADVKFHRVQAVKAIVLAVTVAVDVIDNSAIISK